MVYSDMTDEDVIEHFNKHRKSNGDHNIAWALQELGKRPDDKSTTLRFYKALNNQSANGKQETEIRSLKAKIRTLQKEVDKDESIKEFVQRTMYEMNSVEFDTVPKWIEHEEKKNKLIPVLMLTDLHVGEVVKKDEIGVNNNYNTPMAYDRVNQVTDDFIRISKNGLGFYKYDGVVLILGGDNVTGNIHDLAETNDRTPIQQVIDCTEILAQQINKLKAKFGKVFIPAVTGNHSRLSHRRTKTKGRVHDSLETLIYANLGTMYRSDKDITIVHNEADYVRFTLNGRRFRLEHGDNFKGGGGIGGIHVPIMRGIAKKSKTAVATNQAFDTMVIGHFHQHFISNSLIIGASPKGYDEYSKMMGFEFEIAGATMFCVNGHGDIIFGTNIKCRDKETANTEGIQVWQ
jgi:hypothetical protein